MSDSHEHQYRGYTVKIDCVRSFPSEKFSGTYLITAPGGKVLLYGITIIVPTQKVAEELALSLAVKEVDMRLKVAQE